MVRLVPLKQKQSHSPKQWMVPPGSHRSFVLICLAGFAAGFFLGRAHPLVFASCVDGEPAIGSCLTYISKNRDL